MRGDKEERGEKEHLLHQSKRVKVKDLDTSVGESRKQNAHSPTYHVPAYNEVLGEQRLMFSSHLVFVHLK